MPRDNLMPTQADLLEFSEVYLRVIACSWTDEVFKKALIADPQSALRNYFGYVLPWNLNLSVKPCPPGHEWIPGVGGRPGTWELPKNMMTFGVPTAPKLHEQAVALAAYNDAGPTYLFTCC